MNILFAHQGVNHETEMEAIAHSSSSNGFLYLALGMATLAIILTAIVVLRQQSKSQSKNRGE